MEKRRDALEFTPDKFESINYMLVNKFGGLWVQERVGQENLRMYQNYMMGPTMLYNEGYFFTLQKVINKEDPSQQQVNLAVYIGNRDQDLVKNSKLYRQIHVKHGKGPLPLQMFLVEDLSLAREMGLPTNGDVGQLIYDSKGKISCRTLFTKEEIARDVEGCEEFIESMVFQNHVIQVTGQDLQFLV
mmetsp:Transcript_11243/g.18923  ORF Transcript_11243/g.18923 Transcript_11243/m.18923 type:complete len:187 (-) Transcript_11243:2016-2576(-)